MLAGIILLSAMAAGGIALWYRRRKDEQSDMGPNDQDLNW